MAEITTIAEAVGGLIDDGDCVALEGFTHLIPFAAAHELIRQGKQDLTLSRLTPDLICDQLIGMGCAERLVFSWGGNPGIGSLHRFRDAVEHGFPRPLQLEEHTHAGLVARYQAGAAGLPFGVLRGYAGTSLLERARDVDLIACPFTGERVAAVKALRPTVTVIHAQQADERGNVALWGISGVQKEAVLGAKRSIVTVEAIVPDLAPQHPNPVILPSWAVTAVVLAPGGSHPSYALGYSDRDHGFYRRWDAISRDRDAFLRWMNRHVLGTRDHREYLTSIEASA